MTWRMHKTKDKRWRERCLTPSMVKSRSQTFQLCCFCHVWAKRSRTEPEYQNRSMRNPPRRDQSLTACCTPPHGLHPPAHRLFHFSSQGGSSWIINTAPSSFSTTASKLELSADLSGQLLPTGVLRPAANQEPVSGGSAVLRRRVQVWPQLHQHLFLHLLALCGGTGQSKQTINRKWSNKWPHCFKIPTRLSWSESRTVRKIVSHIYDVQACKSVLRTVVDWRLEPFISGVTQKDGPVIAQQPIRLHRSCLFFNLFGAAGSIMSRLEQPVIWPNFLNWELTQNRFRVCGKMKVISIQPFPAIIEGRNSFAHCHDISKRIFPK